MPISRWSVLPWWARTWYWTWTITDSSSAPTIEPRRRSTIFSPTKRRAPKSWAPTRCRRWLANWRSREEWWCWLKVSAMLLYAAVTSCNSTQNHSHVTLFERPPNAIRAFSLVCSIVYGASFELDVLFQFKLILLGVVTLTGTLSFDKPAFTFKSVFTSFKLLSFIPNHFHFVNC